MSLHFLSPEYLSLHHKPCARFYEVCTLGQVLQLGLLTTYIFYRPDLESLVFPVTLVAAGAIGAGTASLGINKTIRRFYPALVISPFLLSLTMHPTTENFILACVCIIFAFYIYISTKNIYTDYWGSILNNALLNEQAIELKHLSTTDPLTQIHNRLYFDSHLDREWKRAYRTQQPVTAMFIDLDYFKLVNDKFGHDTGDLCLKKAAALLQKYAQRAGDTLARYGGEEFVVFFSDTEAGNGAKIAEDILSDFRSLQISSPKGPINLRCSIGISSHVPNDSVKPSDLLTDADKALYKAKEKGRDCYQIFESKPKPLPRSRLRASDAR